MPGTTEAELLCRARSGDRAAEEELGAKLSAPLRRYVARQVADPFETDEILQDCRLALHLNLHHIEGPGHLRPFVFRVARNLCFDGARRRERRAEVWYVNADDALLLAPAPERPPEESVHWVLVWDEVRRAIDRLPEPHRETILLLQEGLSHDEIAEVLRLPIGTVKSRVHNARKRIAQLLRPGTREALGIEGREEHDNAGTG